MQGVCNVLRRGRFILALSVLLLAAGTISFFFVGGFGNNLRHLELNEALSILAFFGATVVGVWGCMSQRFAAARLTRRLVEVVESGRFDRVEATHPDLAVLTGSTNN